MSTKQLLYNYPSYVQAIHNYRQQILVATGERTYPSGISNYSIEPPSVTNEFHSTTETHAIRNIINQAREIDKIQRDLREYERVVRAINLALVKLREIDRKLIELRYFEKPKLSWVDVAERLEISDRHAKRLEKRVISNLEIELRHVRIIKSR